MRAQVHMRRKIMSLATSAGLALAALVVPAAAGQITPAAAASTCHDSFTLQNTFGYWTDDGSTSGNEIYVANNLEFYPDIVWCTVTGQTAYGITFELFRAQGTSLCAQYSGAVSAAGDVILADCHSDRLAQNWVFGSVPYGYLLTTEYQWSYFDGFTPCLSSYANETESTLYMVSPPAGCNGSGGQTWNQYSP
jgi:ABC-type glycerol-3-phosphate transport system substrate-binding protein